MANRLRRFLQGRLRSFLDKPGGPLWVALGSAVAVAGLVGTVASFRDFGSPRFLSCVFISMLVIAFWVLWAASDRQIKKWKAKAARETKVYPEEREELQELTRDLDEEKRNGIKGIVDRHVGAIETLQDELARARRREIPGKPLLIAAGAFLMGDDRADDDAKPRHEVFVNSFLIDRYPVTKGEYGEFLADPDGLEWLPDEVYRRYSVPYALCDWYDSGDGRVVPPTGEWDHPVVNVNWFAAVAFCNWRSKRDDLEPVYVFSGNLSLADDFTKRGWRLPTEAQWEKAARGGKTGPFPWDGELTPQDANYNKHYRGTTPVGRFRPNDFGLYDALGNVKEWCHDRHGQSTYRRRCGSEVRNPTGPEAGNTRVFRGGSWLDRVKWITVYKRGRLPPQNTNPDFGFRCVRIP